MSLDDSQLVTLKLESGNYLRFQPDTGAQCNVVPLHLYNEQIQRKFEPYVKCLDRRMLKMCSVS